PDDMVIATTEIGVLSAANPRKTVVDMAGLNETGFAHDGFSANRLFQEYNPDVIYMPHPDYDVMIAQITTNPYFIAHYEYLPGPSLHTFLGVAIRRDGRYYAALHQALEEVRIRAASSQ
ncbi:MAG: hypothetical protein WCF84_02115, partial [Anaerolineae bacterium]